MALRSVVVASALWTGDGKRPSDLQQMHWPQGPGGPVVEIEHGLIEGSTRTDHKTSDQVAVDGFFGIPYAEPPLFKNRFRAPQPYSVPWGNATRMAKKVAPACPQWELGGKIYFGDENCLYLNVYRPAGLEAGADVPVMFWIYGGGFFMGDGYNGLGTVGNNDVALYDGYNMVKNQKHVIVTHNYRLNALGHLALPELAEEDPHGSVGNWAMMDQRAAMQWTQRNIRTFGGNPNMVTIAGESAGAISVGWHLASVASGGLFHAAILQSSDMRSQWFTQKKEFAIEFYEEWMEILGCSGPSRLECMRELPTEKMMVPVMQWVTDWLARFAGNKVPKDVPSMASPLWPAAPFAPVIDGTDVGLHDFSINMVEKGKFNRVPVIVGHNEDDGGYWGPILPLLWGGFPFFGYDLNKLAEWNLPDSADRERMLMLYGESQGFPKSNTWHKDAFKRFFRDLTFGCTNSYLSTALSKAGVPVFSYVMSFDYDARFPVKTVGDAHAFELVFTWKNGDKFWGFLRNDLKNYKKMSDIMSCMWSSFVVCHEPKCEVPVGNCASVLASVADWPAFNANTTSRQYYRFTTQPTVEIVQRTTKFGEDQFPGDNRCDFWKTANMDWQGMRRNIDHPNMDGCGVDGDCLSDGQGCCNAIKYNSSKCGKAGKCGCVEDGTCVDRRNGPGACCTGKLHHTTLCVSQKQCGCLADGQCLNVEADESDCCSGTKSAVGPLVCPALKQCGPKSATLV